ncbi:MAG: dTDP-4-dehydrorhamnose 3,5-epimerase [bacterium]|nr:dTDP-4-dehydrorhamnose 3,5-epimerase [bacterium]
MKFNETEIPGVILIEPTVHRDDRGWFFESYQAEHYHDGGIEVDFVQDNHSRSCRGTLRGLHAQGARPQDKLVRVLFGEIYDVAVDVRRGSPTFGKYVGAVLSAENFRQLFIPAGFVHGFVVTSDLAEVEYKCSDYYDPGGELSVAWNDPQIGIDWPVADPLLSPKDAEAPALAEIDPQVLPIYPGDQPR